ncbi:MAG: hypothetical protein R3E97_21765 [Candidatus Eisenbacteria bacterium]
MDLGELRFDYTDCESNASANVTWRLHGEATLDQAEVTASVDNLVAAEATAHGSGEGARGERPSSTRNGDKDLAKQNLADLSTKLSEANVVFRSERLAKKLEQLQMEADDMDRADESAENRQVYLKGSKNRLYNSMYEGKARPVHAPEAGLDTKVEQLQTKLQELQLRRSGRWSVQRGSAEGRSEAFRPQNPHHRRHRRPGHAPEPRALLDEGRCAAILRAVGIRRPTGDRTNRPRLAFAPDGTEGRRYPPLRTDDERTRGRETMKKTNRSAAGLRRARVTGFLLVALVVVPGLILGWMAIRAADREEAVVSSSRRRSSRKSPRPRTGSRNSSARSRPNSPPRCRTR